MLVFYYKIAHSPSANYFVSKIHNPGNGNAIGGIKFAVSPDSANFSWAGIKALTSASADADILAFYTSASNTSGDSSTERMRIDEAGRSGIGTASPSQNLHVVGNGLFTGGLTIGDSAADTFVTKGHTHLATLGNNVGIGTTSPNRKLHVSGSGGTVAAKIEATDGSQASLDLTNSEGAYRLINDGGQFFIYDDTDSRQPFTINTSGTTILKGGTSYTSDHALIVRNSSSTALFSIRNDGRIDIGGSQVFDISRNMSNIGTISSGAITASGVDNLLQVFTVRGNRYTNALHLKGTTSGQTLRYQNANSNFDIIQMTMVV